MVKKIAHSLRESMSRCSWRWLSHSLQSFVRRDASQVNIKNESNYPIHVSIWLYYIYIYIYVYSKLMSFRSVWFYLFRHIHVHTYTYARSMFTYTQQMVCIHKHLWNLQYSAEISMWLYHNYNGNPYVEAWNAAFQPNRGPSWMARHSVCSQSQHDLWRPADSTSWVLPGLSPTKCRLCDKLAIMWEKQCHKPPIWEWLIHVNTTYLWWFGGWSMIVLPILVTY